LTLLFIAGSASREELLEMLERALQGGLLPAPDPKLLEEEELDYEVELDDEDYEDLLEAIPQDLLESHDLIDPHSKMKASSKGHQMLFVAFTLERWLRNCPDGPLRIGQESGDAIAALACCWSATVTHALAREPLTLPELDRAIEILSYATVEEHLEAMERTGLVEVLTEGGETRYAPTEWLREGIAPLAAAARFERHYPEDDTAPPDILDVEASFQLTLPLLQLPADLSGSCRLGVQMPGSPPLMAGATAQVAGGRVLTSSTLLEENPETWATGSPVDWLDTLVAPSANRIEAGGDIHLVGALLQGLHARLFGVRLD
jgi:DNA-binding HxlR family transcriptional regulator